MPVSVSNNYIYLTIYLSICLLRLETKREVTLQTKLFDERWSKHRSVTDVGWSPNVSSFIKFICFPIDDVYSPFHGFFQSK